MENPNLNEWNCLKNQILLLKQLGEIKHRVIVVDTQNPTNYYVKEQHGKAIQ